MNRITHLIGAATLIVATSAKAMQEALAVVETSDQANAKRWEPSVRSNIGEALYDLGRYDEALDQFKRALTLFEQGTNKRWIRDAHWQVARTLRALNRTDEALTTQLRLERESDGAGEPKSYIFEELKPPTKVPEAMLPNNTFEWTVGHRGPHLAAARSSWPAAQRGR